MSKSSELERLSPNQPEGLRSIQEVIGMEESLAHAVTLFLPNKTEPTDALRELLASRSYIVGP